MIVSVILAVEVMFWVLVLSGLGARYLLRLRRLSTVLLLLVPVLDIVLLAIIAWHLRSGGTADFSHGTGALYLGFTVAYGHSVIRWVDVRFAHRFAGGPAPTKPPKVGMARVRREARECVRGLAAAAIGAGTLGLLILVVGDPSRTAALNGYLTPIGIFAVVNTAISVWDAVSALTPGRATAHDSPAAGNAPSAQPDTRPH